MNTFRIVQTVNYMYANTGVSAKIKKVQEYIENNCKIRQNILLRNVLLQFVKAWKCIFKTTIDQTPRGGQKLD